MSNQIQIKVAELNQLNPLMIADDSRVEQKFILMYNAIWGTRPRKLQIYEKEKFNFRKILQDKPELQRCSPLSLYGCFLDIAVNGLSLDPTGRPHCYILPRSTKTGYKDNMATISMNCVLTFPSPVMGNWLCASVPDRSGM